MLKWRDFLPFLIGATLSIVLGLTLWKYFIFVFSWIGFSITIGNIVNRRSKDHQTGRRLAMILIMPLFIVFFGIMQRENMQIEETVFYLAYFFTGGIFTRVLIHFIIAKVAGPFIWGRGFCGWACWTAAALEWLPIKGNKAIPKGFTYIRIPMLILSLIIPFLLIMSGYDYKSNHVFSNNWGLIQTEKFQQLLWFLAGNAVYYISGIILAFVFQKKRAFCKILCPVSLVMKAQTKIALIKIKPNGTKCIECGKCSKNCPMDVDVMSFISKGESVTSSECILCGACKPICPVQAIG